MVDKLRDKYWYYDGYKSILLEQYPDSAWTFLSNGPQNDELDYYKFIPTLYRAATIRGNEIAAMPFEIYKGNSEEPYDSSNDYQNKIGFMKNPFQLLQLVEMALVLTGRAYLFKERSRAAPKDLRYIIPTSVTPKIDPIKGLEYFERPVGATIQRFTTDDIVYFWMPDPYVELGPALHYPGQAAANACGVLINIDLFASHFFERGAIKAMLLTVKGMPVQAEREKLETWFQSFVGGIKNAWRAKVVNAEMVEPVVVGEGMKELENQQVTTEKREDICLALGVPQTLLFANSANFATAQQDELNFLNGTIIPECTFISSILNEQIFEPLGYHWEFLPESLDAMQEDEQSRSGALVQLVSALADPISEVAMDILGYELSDEQMAKLQEIWKEKQERAEQMAQLTAMAPKQEDEKPEEEKPEDEGEKPNPFEKKGLKYSDDQERDEQGRWTDGGGGGESDGGGDSRGGGGEGGGNIAEYEKRAEQIISKVKDTPPREMTAGAINKELDVLEKYDSEIGDMLTNSGRGLEKAQETRQKTDPIARAWQTVLDRRYSLLDEIVARTGTNYGHMPPGFKPRKLIDIDLEKWKVKSLKRLREGESAAVEFISDYIPESMTIDIKNKLESCKTAEDVRRVFGVKYSDDQARDESGRWTDEGGGGGSSGGGQSGSSGSSGNIGSVRVYHGSTSEVADNIKSQGINPIKEQRAGQGTPSYSYVTKSETNAVYWAEYKIDTVGLDYESTDIVVFELDIPSNDYASFTHDPDSSSKDDLRFKGNIPPDWIKDYKIYTFNGNTSGDKYSPANKAKGVGVFIPILVNRSSKRTVDPMLALVAELKRANDLLERTGETESNSSG